MVHCKCETAGRFLANTREVDLALRALGGVWSACGGLVGRGGVWWADAVKIGKILSASSPTSQELFGVVACC